MKTTRHSFFPSLNFSSLFSHLPLSSLFLTSLTFLFATAAQAQVPSYVPTNGLVGYWPFNGNANDESGNGNNGTVNGATLTADRFGDGNKAYEFFNSTIEVPHNQNLGFGSDASFSVSFWFNKTTNNSPYHFMGKRVNGSPTFNWQLGGTNIETSFGSSPPGLYVGAIFSSAQLNSVWTLLTGVYDNGNWKLFQNGLQVLSNNAQAGPDSNCPLTFGNSGSYEYFGGSLDDIGIWNRALTADEVLSLYNGCNVTALAVSGNVIPSQFTQETYTYPNTAGSTYNWTLTNGVIVSGQGTNSIVVMWANTGIGSVSVVETNASNCTGDVVTYDVVVIPTNIEELSNTLILYPNPATTELNLQTTSDLIGTDLFVFDALGKQILKQQILSTNTIINTSSFAVGNYVVKVGGGVKKFELVR